MTAPPPRDPNTGGSGRIPVPCNRSPPGSTEGICLIHSAIEGSIIVHIKIPLLPVRDPDIGLAVMVPVPCNRSPPGSTEGICLIRTVPCTIPVPVKIPLLPVVTPTEVFPIAFQSPVIGVTGAPRNTLYPGIPGPGTVVVKGPDAPSR